MTTRISSTACAALAVGLMTTAVVAQNLSSSRSQNGRASQSASARSVTITGCLQRGTESATGTTGTSGSTRTASAGGFMLMNASMGPQSTSASSGSSTASVRAGTASAGAQYRLEADDSKLTPHVGHKVEVTGSLEESASAGSSSASGSATSTAAAAAPRLKVDTVKMVSSTCP